MNFQQNYFFLCKTPLSAEGAEDVEVLTRAEDSTDFSRVFKEYEEKRSHAFNSDNIYSVVRADDIYDLIRMPNEKKLKKKLTKELLLRSLLTFSIVQCKEKMLTRKLS